MSSVNPSGHNHPINKICGGEGRGGGSKEGTEPSVSHPFEGKNPAIASVAAAALEGALKTSKTQKDTSEFFDYQSFGVETVEEYLSLCLQRVRTHLVEKTNVRANPEIGKNVMLLLTPLAGFGDILFIYKAAQALKAENFNVSIRIVEVVENDPLKVKKQLQKMANMEDIEILTPDSEESDFKPDCVIIAPTIPHDKVIDEVVKPLGIPFEKIYEYGGNKFYEDKSTEIWEKYRLVKSNIDALIDSLVIKSGMGVGELGIFTENGLIKPLSKKEKVEKLDLMAIDYPEKLDPILQGKSALEYLDSTKLFFGYAHKEDSMERFVHTIAFLNKEQKINIDIVLPWRKEKLMIRSEFSKSCTYQKEKLAEAGIDRIEVINSEGTFSENISHDGTGKVLRIINVFPFTNPQMRDLLSVSEDPVLATGDQSLNEAILFSKLPLYEEMKWKHSVAESLLKKATPYPRVFNVLSNWSERAERETAESIAYCIQESFEGSQMQSFHTSIINPNNSLEKNLCNEALRLLALGKNSEFKAESERLENEVKKIFNIPIFIEFLCGILYPTLSKLDEETYESFRLRFNKLLKLVTGIQEEVVIPSSKKNDFLVNEGEGLKKKVVVDTDSRKYYEAQWEVFNYNRASNDQCIYKFFISKYNEIDKSSLPTDVIESVVRLIDIFDGPKNTLFINGAYELILKIRKLLFQLTEDKLKQIKL